VKRSSLASYLWRELVETPMSAVTSVIDFLSRGKNSGVEIAFEILHRTGVMPAGMVRAVIAESWQRCYGAGIDPSHPPVRCSSARVPKRTLLVRNRELLDASDRVITQARETLAGCGTLMVLADATGLVLHVDGDDSALAAAAEVSLTAGSTWSEAAYGTSGLGTALVLGQPVHVHAAEHYCLWARSWTCSATVIRDPVNDAILGAISLAGPSATFDPHLLALALATASGVSAELRERENLRREQLLEYAVKALSHRTTPGLMLFDRRGRLVTADTRAGLVLAAVGLTAQSVAGARVAALDIRDAADVNSQLPGWLQPEWLEPVVIGADRIGTMIKIPSTIECAPRSEGALPRYKLRRVTEFINANLSRSISLDDLAGIARASRFHFHRQFKKAVGVTPHDYIMHLRIERAKAMLVESDAPIAEVSGAVGFVDQSHFSSSFRKVTLMTPRGYRNSVVR
jgi:AraC-like DNA-binding protein